jgi:hypothetical protein
MNIFLLADNYCPIQSAKELCNKHSSRMPLETAGMLVFAFPENETPVDNKRSHSHYNHPASIWTRNSLANMEWVILHGLAQCEEYTRRYKRQHKAQDTIEWVERNYKNVDFVNDILTDYPRCFGPHKEELDNTEPDTLTAYRKFYWLDKCEFAKWPSMNEIPNWWPEKTERFVDKYFKDGSYIKR